MNFFFQKLYHTLKAIDTGDSKIREGEMVIVKELADGQATIVTSSSSNVVVPSSILVSKPEFDNIVNKKVTSFMTTIKEAKSLY